MTVSMRVMSAGRGYDYLLKSVVRGDRDMDGTALTRYYTEAGTPPGRWLGSGLHVLGNGEIGQGDVVTPQQLALLLRAGRDPVTGEPLGRAFPEYDGAKARVAARVARLPRGLSDEQRRQVAAEIAREEVAAGTRRAVAGYDFTFSVPKSVSVLWGVADAGTQALILEAHHEAMEEVLALLEREVAVTRRGVDAGDGAVGQADIVGIVATAYDHWDSRVGDPQLHTHVVISNKVNAAGDGRWRSLDGRPLHVAVVALSAHYNAVLADRITGVFGIDWEERDRGKNHNPAWELECVPESLIGEFSSRSRMIEKETDRLIAEHVARHGHRPSATRIIERRAKVTLETRPDKVIRSLFDLTTEWRERAQTVLGASPMEWARDATARPVARPMLRADDIPLHVVAEVGASVVDAVSQKRSTWRHWNLWAEASRQTMGWRFATIEDREAVVGMIVDAAKQESLRLTPPELAITPEVFRRRGGSTVFRPRHCAVFTSAELLAAEDRLLGRSEDRTAPALGRDVIERAARKEHLLSAEQVETLARIVVSGRQVDLLVGPAGAGKTTAMHALKTAWTNVHGKGSVVGLAPSAVAAQMLAEDLGIGCENTAKWLHDHDRDHDGGRARFRSGQLVIIDEATLAGTLALDRITALAADAGAKVLLVGDWAQLESVEAGGAFALLVSARPDSPELTEVHRFTHEWEKTASLDLRVGRTDVISTYVRNDRIREGTTDEMMDAAYVAWRDDARSGRTAILVAEATATVRCLNTRARAERIAGGDTAGSLEVHLADGTRASVGDLVVTRRNDRRLHTMHGGRCGDWVRNGDRWRVTHLNDDGSITAKRGSIGVSESVTLPAAYVAEHLDLGYAVTAHRAQGITVDTAHVVVSSATTRENLYVSMTRGSEANTAYVALDHPDEIHAPPGADDVTARTVLYGVLKHSGAELSAHQTIVAEQEQWSSIAQLAAEYETIAAVAQYDRWINLMEGCGLTEAQLDSVLEADSFSPLTAELRRAEANHHDVDQLLPALVARRSLEDADDVGAVLISRLRKAARAARGKPPREAKYIVGLIPAAEGPMSLEMSAALHARQRLMEARAMALAVRAVAEDEPWLKRLGTPPATDAARNGWLNDVRTVAAYRDRYQVHTSSTLDQPRTEAQKFDAAQAKKAIRRARAIAQQDAASRSEGGSRRMCWSGRDVDLSAPTRSRF